MSTITKASQEIAAANAYIATGRPVVRKTPTGAFHIGASTGTLCDPWGWAPISTGQTQASCKRCIHIAASF